MSAATPPGQQPQPAQQQPAQQQRAHPKPANASPKITWAGFTLGQYGGWGLLVLFFALGYMAINGEEGKSASVYKRARPVAKYDAGHPVYVTGVVVSEDLGGPQLKPGKYLTVRQTSEVFAWTENVAPKNQNLVYHPSWTDAPKAPSTFKEAAHRGERLYPKAQDLKTLVPKDARVAQDGKEYKLDMADVELPTDMPFVPPKADQLIVGPYKFTDTEGTETLILYENEACKSAPTLGCQRVRLSVIPKPEGNMTFIGKLDGDRITKFDGTLKGSHGDLQELMAAYSFSDGAGRFMLAIQRLLCFLGIWAGLGMTQRPLRRLLSFAPKLATASTFLVSGIVATALGSITYLLHTAGLLVAFAAVVALLVASREPPATQTG
jgi:hypothetical protein